MITKPATGCPNRVKLLDFGLAILVEPAAGHTVKWNRSPELL